MLLDQARVIETNLGEAIHAVEQRDVDLALSVIGRDGEIDKMDIEIFEECLHTLALYQPVASDLRFVASLLTINKDLERIGDHCVNLAEQAIFMSRENTTVDPPFDLEQETTRVRQLLKWALDALVHSDAELAERVLQADDEIDRIHRGVYERTIDSIRRAPEHTAWYIDLLNVSKHLERVADHAVNIAEDVIYLVRGEIVRHAKPSHPGSTP